MTITEAVKESECCCSCRHNLRKHDERQAGIYCECEIDGHYIGYIACFESVCDEYRAESEGGSR